MSANNQNVLIEVYKEHTASWRHEDNILYKFGAFLLPVSLIVLGMPYVGDIKESSLTSLEIISTVGGMILMTFWVSYVYASHAKIRARFQIINEIECQIERDYGIKGHKDIRDIRDNAFKPLRPLRLRTHFLEKSIFYVYWVMATILTVCRSIDKWTICKSLAIVSLIPLITGGLAIAIALIYDYSIRQGEICLDKLRDSQQTKNVR